jgi:hypothetical protein
MQDFTPVIDEGYDRFGPTNVDTEIHAYIIHHLREGVPLAKKAKV